MSGKLVRNYGIGLAGAAALNWWLGKRGKDLVVDTALYGAVIGTGITVVSHLGGEDDLAGLGALMNSMGVSPVSTITGANEGMGSLSRKAVAYLAHLNPDLLSDYQDKSLKIGEVPPDPNVIILHK